MKANYSPRILTAAALMTGLLTVLAGEARKEFHQTYELNSGGEVSLDNVTGSVHIRTWDREEIKVDAVTHAKTEDLLEGVEIDVQSTPDKIQLKTKYPKSNDVAASVDYTLTVPRDSKVKKVNLVNGAVEIKGVRGEVEVNSVNGPITANGVLGKTTLSTVSGPVKAVLKELAQPVSLSSVNGTVTVALVAKLNANLSAATVHGGISCDFPITIEKSFPLGQKLQEKLGEGGPQITLSTVNGGIHIDRAEEDASEDGDL